ncbi:sulfotransferase family 2 domain-containing protein [Chloroflexota bacterium]
MISVEKRFLFIHMPKTGGNSIQTILKEYSEDKFIAGGTRDGINRFGIENEKYGTVKHSTLSEYESALEPELYNSLFKFAVIRNPWDRMVSLYFSSNVRDWNREAFRRIVEAAFPLRHFIVVNSPIQNVLRKYDLRREQGRKTHLGIDMERILRRLKFPISSDKKNLIDDIDYLLRFETLDEDFKLVCEQLDIPHVPLPVVNVSERVHYSQYYNEELKELVRRKFAEEIEFGKYQFEDAD